MYCPHCGIHNEREQRFCRQCGQPLGSVQLALDGRIDEVRDRFDKAEDLVAAGLLIFSIFFVSGFVSLFIAGSGYFVFSAILGFVICLPIVLTGLVRVDRLGKALTPKEKSGEVILKQVEHSAAVLPESRKTDSLPSGAPSSVTEHTTFTLRVPK